uniref:DUF834 domain-containing protein n=1 Tax=Oryza glaberrima TaxID=4538 RepID=I1NPH1_ORYGL
MASDGASGEVRYGVARVEDDATARPSATAATAFAPPRGARVFPIPHHHHASSRTHTGQDEERPGDTNSGGNVLGA